MIRSFDSERALSYVEMWEKNLFVVEVYLIDEERKEGEGRTRASWDLETPLEKRSSGEE